MKPKNLKLAAYGAAKRLGLFALARRLTRHQTRILCYHAGALADEWQFNPLLFMTRSTFLRRIDWLQAHDFAAVPLATLSQPEPPSSLAAGCKVIITFDDGWFSTGSELLDLLCSRGIPSTLYLSTKHFQDGHVVIPVLLNYLLWKSTASTVVVADCDRALDGRYDLRDQQQRRDFEHRALGWLERISAAKGDVDAAMLRLASVLGIATVELGLSSRRFSYLSAQELQQWSSRGCSIELHGHVHSYPCGQAEQFKADLQACFTAIAAISLPTPHHYCYPAGVFDEHAAPVLRSLGVLTATTCIPGLVTRLDGDRCFYLPRFLDGENITMLEFEAEMSGFAELLRGARRALTLS